MQGLGSLSDVKGILVGHWTDYENITGCTVVLCEKPCMASVDVRGGGPGTRETDLLEPGRLVEKVDAILLSGGSAFGLAAADGVMNWLHERGRGVDTGVVPVPIVPAAIIFDLSIGKPVWPGTDAGHAACEAASSVWERGSVGAGTGATVGKFYGFNRAMKGGIGTASIKDDSGLIVSALAVVNALGNIYDTHSGNCLAGARGDDCFLPFPNLASAPKLFGNTTLAVVATNALLNKSQCQRLAQMAQCGMARAIRPINTQWDGDAIFSLATGEISADVSLAGILAAEALELAIADSVLSAKSLGGIPCWADISPLAAKG